MGVELVGPRLPAEHAGKAIVWTSWREPVGARGRTVVQRPCEGCGYVEPLWVADGRVDGVQRACGHYCPGCRELWVHWKVPPAPREYVGHLDLIVHSTQQERIDEAMARVAEQMRRAIQAEFRRFAREDLRRNIVRTHGE